jgi:hypothetical protein
MRHTDDACALHERRVLEAQASASPNVSPIARLEFGWGW